MDKLPIVQQSYSCIPRTNTSERSFGHKRRADESRTFGRFLPLASVTVLRRF